jgi:RNA polymerase sigma factor, sigma-70 family
MYVSILGTWKGQFMIDRELFQKALDGDRKSIEQICSETWKPVYRYIYYKVQNRAEAEDITQETFMRALASKQASFMNEEKFIGFLKTIALNIIRDKWRKNKRRGSEVALDTMDPCAAVGDDAEAGTMRILLQEGLKSLTEEQRRVIELRIIQGYSAAETGRLMGKKEGTIRQIQYRALQALAKVLDIDGGQTNG